MRSYKNLSNQSFFEGKYSIEPIRYEDRLSIMKWRNEQMYHLRQNKQLTEVDQTIYFNTIVNKLFDKEFPDQLLFSFLEDSKCIGYGGLVHINWGDKNAEISFIMDTTLEKDYFQQHWKTFLNLIEKVAFKELQLHKIFTFAFDVRPHLYIAIEAAGLTKEATLKEHCFFNNEYKDVIIHSKTVNDEFELVKVTAKDVQLLFDWTNDPSVRENSLNSNPISWAEHVNWLNNRLEMDSNIFILHYKKQAVGMIRFDHKNDHFLVNYSIDKIHRGKGYGKKIIEAGLQKIDKNLLVKAIVKKDNIASITIFNKLNFEKLEGEDPSVFYFIKKNSK